MMEVPTARRKLNTYGKGARKVRVHDLFDVGSQSLFPSADSKQDAPIFSTLGPEAGVLENADERHVKPNTVCHTERKHQSDLATSSPPLLANDTSTTYDLQSSSDESSMIKPRPALKKRKTLPATTTIAKSETKPKSDLKVAALDQHGSGKQDGSDKPKVAQYRSLNANAAAANSRLNKSSDISNQPTKSINTKLANRATSTSARSQNPVTISQLHQPREIRINSGSSADFSDASDHSHPSHRSTPKRKRGSSEVEVSPPTPSDLRLTSLRLTSGPRSRISHTSSEDEQMVDAPAPIPRKGRARMIDRLDAPQVQDTESSTSSMTGMPEQMGSPPSQHPTAKVTPGDEPNTVASRPALERQDSNVAVVPSGRRRPTYGKQRSHLRDMVNSLDSLPPSNSQTSSQQSYSQALSFNSVGSRIELELEDSDEPDAFSQIKSIHELRRGGAVRQFDLEVESIVEDIESSSKSRRITGLIQLVKKFDQDQTSLRHFQDSENFQRLVDCAGQGLDDVGATFMALVVQSLLSMQSSSSGPLIQMLECLYRLPARLLSEHRMLSKIARERTLNLSKALIKDIMAFETNSTEAQKPAIHPGTILLGSIESAQRKIIGLKEPLPRLPRRMLEIILFNFIKPQEGEVEGRLQGQFETTRLSLSVLEIASANHELSESGLASGHLQNLAQTVAGIMSEASHSEPAVEHSCLRLIVSLSNNDEAVCRALSRTELINVIFQVVDDHFLTLAGLTSLEKEFDHGQLESVILAVGCLLNLAECADEARIAMLSRGTDEKSLVDRLVDIFNSHVDQANEALTIDQTQILVAFGYISALLCTLCLNAEACQCISETTRGEGLSHLFSAAETFLRHLRTVEAVLEEDGTTATGFTTRFNIVLDTVKVKVGQ